MSEYTIYHNPRCSKSRQTLALLEEQGIAPTIVKYLEDVPSVEELSAVLAKLQKSPADIVRKGEAVYKELGLSAKTLSDAEWLAVFVENPKLIERPIVVKGDRAVLGRPPENVKDLF